MAVRVGGPSVRVPSPLVHRYVWSCCTFTSHARVSDKLPSGAPRAKQFPASFVVPTAVPQMSQMTRDEAAHRQKILGILNSMKLPKYNYAFAYGSGVFSQTTKAKAVGGTAPMIDMVIAVQNPAHWHAMNMRTNPHHYPWWARMFGEWAVRATQNLGAKMWYVPYVQVQDEIVKYGVISLEDMCEDLLCWTTLYVSGRMHKPIARLFDATNGRVPIAEQANLTSALRTALLLLPEEFSEKDLYYMVSSLSYLGDFRMSVPGGENRNKVKNIVENQLPWFRIMCADLITRLRFIHVSCGTDSFKMRQDISPQTRATVAANLARNLRLRLIEHFLQRPQLHPLFKDLQGTDPQTLVPDTPHVANENTPVDLAYSHGEDSDQLPPLATRFWLAVVQQETFPQALREEIATIVRQPAFMQSLKGLYTAGVGRSLRYLWSKMSKFRQGRKEAQK
ncbi:hypothetical protein MEQU1_001255 [Malassezia equina]|uniref:Phosphatidate cytidylyltransferase, mitochondrial n=1 Tax=Malassezia equina TaxID=1381935 RepID=A0AAF0IZK2_9BASI|nr:hypothetical protein MEQU1_001255 [Malassezia equina]